MDLFFSPDLFSPEEDLRKLEEKADYLQSFSGVSITRSILNESKNIHSILMNNSCVARTINLLRLILMRVFNFFEFTSLNEIFKTIMDYPDKMTAHLSPRISQAFTLLILNIHKNLGTFAELVVNYLSFDPSMNYLFAYSTFPAIFGYFTLDYLCELGGDFLIEIFKHQKSNAIRRSRSTGSYFWTNNDNHQNYNNQKVINFANSMVASFFISMHQFFHCLWSIFRTKIIYQPKDIKQLFQFFCDALDNAAYYLTSYHQVVLSTYIAIDRENCTSVIFQDVFAVSLKENFPELTDLFNFFIYLGDQPRSEESNQVFTILTRNRKFSPNIPKLPPPNILQRVPIAMSEYDIYIVTEIVDQDKRFASDSVEMMQSKGFVLKKGYLPFYADIIVPVNEWKNQPPCIETEASQPEKSSTASNSIDMIDQKEKIKENEFKRKYLIIQNVALQNGINELDAIKQAIFPDREISKIPIFRKIQNNDKDFAIFALKRYIQSYKDLENQLNNLLFLKQWSKGVKRCSRLAEITKETLLYCFSSLHVDKVNNSIDPKGRMIPQIRFKKLFETILNSSITPPKLMFYTCIKLLNQIAIKQDSVLTDLFLRYKNYSQNELSDAVHKWADENSRIASHLVNEVQVLRMQFNLKVGERIIALLNVMHHLLTLCNKNHSIGYQSLFDFIIEEINPSKIAEIIIVLKVFVVQNKVVTDALQQSEFVYFENLMNSFYKLLRLNPALMKDFVCY